MLLVLKNNALQLLSTDVLNHNADLIRVNETWFTDKQKDADVSLPALICFVQIGNHALV